MSDHFFVDVLLYSSVVSAALVGLVLLFFWRREPDPAYLVWSLAFFAAAIRYLFPAMGLTIEQTDGVGGLYFSGLRGSLLLWGAALFTGLAIGPLRALFLLLGPLLWLTLALQWQWGFVATTLPVVLLAALGYLALGGCFLRDAPGYRWHGHRLFAVAAMVMGLHMLTYPWLRETQYAALGFGLAQLLHYLMAMALLVLWIRREQYHAQQAYATQERALRRVLRSRRRVVQMRRWTDTLLEQISDGVVVMNFDGTIDAFNSAAEHIFGYRGRELLGRPVEMLVPEHLRPLYRENLQRLRAGKGSSLVGNRPSEFNGLHRGGEEFPVEMTLSELSLNDERQLVAIIRDVSERRRHEQRLDYLANHDVLTGLPNRRAFEARVGAELEGNGRAQLIFLDLDDFKLINDTLGHRAGDAALVAMARRLVAAAGSRASVARYSGDEFVIFAPLDEENHTEEWFGKLMATLQQPVAFDRVEFMLSGSFGTALYPRDGANITELVRNADLAMYHAKRAGKNKHCGFQPAMLEELNRTADIATRLKQLDPARELSLAFQARMAMETRQLVGAEVLVRWTTSEGEKISPENFIPVAEETGQILRLGYWVIEESCRALAGWPLRDEEPLILSINLSARQLFDESLVERVEAIRRHYGLDASRLEFEVTESSAMQDLDVAVEVLGRLRCLGYGLSLDDFGTGYSSLSHLRRLPVDTVKIDRSFIEQMDHDRQDRVLVASIIELAGHLDLRVLAEGVETPEQLSLLDSLGCDEVQGFLLSRPVPESRFLETVIGDWHGLNAGLQSR